MVSVWQGSPRRRLAWRAMGIPLRTFWLHSQEQPVVDRAILVVPHRRPLPCLRYPQEWQEAVVQEAPEVRELAPTEHHNQLPLRKPFHLVIQELQEAVQETAQAVVPTVVQEGVVEMEATAEAAAAAVPLRCC